MAPTRRLRMESRGDAPLKAPAHPREAERLEALRLYRILNTEAEKSFDDLAGLASVICGTPISLVSLVDEGRQWFKARVAMRRRGAERRIAPSPPRHLASGSWEACSAASPESWWWTTIP